MNRIFRFLVLLCLVFVALIGCRKKDINNLKNDVNDLKTRVTILENLCKQNNTNINSLQTLVNTSITQNDYITNVTPVTKEDDEVGYTISFTNQTPITIYNGKDGQDGDDGVSPIIGVKMDTDSAYYWTLNGEWLLTDDGKKLRVTGNDGANGQTGSNGTDGVTPKLKIEDENWYVSYDNGETWIFVSSAKGEKGDKGDQGDSMFKSVTSDEHYVYFTLADDSVLKIQKATEVYSRTEIDSLLAALESKIGGGGSTPISGVVKKENGAIQAAFSVSATEQVYFSMGNLQYQASTDIWRFAENQYDIIGDNNSNIDSSYSGYIDMFGWGTSGWNSGARAYQPYSATVSYADFLIGGSYSKNLTLTGSYANADWGVYNAISNGGNTAGMWRTLTFDEWKYVLLERTDASSLNGSATVNGVTGMILLPDDWTTPDGVTFSNGMNGYDSNIYSTTDWSKMEENGAVFLPAAGFRIGSEVNSVGSYGNYWSSSAYGPTYAYHLIFDSGSANMDGSLGDRYRGLSVRLVRGL